MTHKYRLSITLSNKAHQKLNHYSSMTHSSKSFIINTLIKHNSISHQVSNPNEIKYARSNAHLYNLINKIELDYNEFCNNYNQLAMTMNYLQKRLQSGHYSILTSTQLRWIEKLLEKVKNQSLAVNHKTIEAIKSWQQ